MSKETKFRAWDGTGMRHFNLHQVAHGKLYSSRRGREAILAKSPIMQFTGLSDRNGKEIYEGDVLWYEDTKLINDSGEYVVGWDKDCAGFGAAGEWTNSYSATCFGDYAVLSEVVSNIYESPGVLRLRELV